jgi:5,6-dimethylbenzimidazole synthase
MAHPPQFDDAFRQQLFDLLAWRRDVRRFRRDPIAPEILDDLFRQACLAPSVGNSQPWRLVTVNDAARRVRIAQNFEECNLAASKRYEGEDAALYAELKLAGLREAPVHVAVFAERNPAEGKGLGRQTMAETILYSTIGAIQNLWLAARAHHIGLGWVSILDPDAVTAVLEVPKSWQFVRYLCLGYPVEEHMDPELDRAGWQQAFPHSGFIFAR